MNFEQYLVSEYFKHSSIDAVFKSHNYDLPVSFATYHRILNKFGIVKSAGPNSKLSESLHFLSLLNNYKLPLERLYHRHAPASIQISTNTLHRILHHIRLGVTRRTGTVLILTHPHNPHQYLLGQDPNYSYWSLPIGYTRFQDSHHTSITRILQQEVFTDLTIQNKFPKNIIPHQIKEIFTIDIADIKVFVYHFQLPAKSWSYSSFKINNHQFFCLNELRDLKMRPGVIEILEHFQNHDFGTNHNSIFNQNLCYLPLSNQSKLPF